MASDSELPPADDAFAIESMVSLAVTETPVTDIHTHLFPPSFGDLLLYGIDDLLTYHYLIAETFRVTRMPYDAFWRMDKTAQADLIWRELFVERAPISEACRGVLSALKLLGFDPRSAELDAVRAFFRDVSPEDYMERVFDAANVRTAVMTNDPFDDKERPFWREGAEVGDRLRAALRIDPLLLTWPTACTKLKGYGYSADTLLSKRALQEVRRFLEDWLFRTNALYMAVSLPPEFAYPQESAMATLLEECVLPVARERNVPFALMLGVNRRVNPSLRLAGDGVGWSDMRSVERLCARFPNNKFMATLLARENQHELCVAARKFHNLLPFGCWWFLNNLSLVEEITRMRVEMLGFSFVAQHSDARVLDQVVYKWAHYRPVLVKILSEKYADLAATGWRVDDATIRRDVTRLLGGCFWEFLG